MSDGRLPAPEAFDPAADEAWTAIRPVVVAAFEAELRAVAHLRPDPETMARLVRERARQS